MKRMNEKRILRTLIIIMVIALATEVVSLAGKMFSWSSETFTLVLSAAESAGLLFSLVVAIRQLTDSKEIARADFLVELNRTFTESQGNMELYTALQDCVDSKCEKGTCDSEESKCTLEIPKVVVSNYLTFFETIYLLERNKVITFEMIDDLFGYRFFLAVHSKYVQQAKLAPQPENFKNIFCLEYEWLQYREKKAHKKDVETSVFKTRQLKNLMKTDAQKRIYEEWIRECRRF